MLNPVLKQTFLSLDGRKLNQNRIIMNKVNFKIEKAVNGHILRSDICGVRVYEKKEDLCAFIASSLVNGIKLKDGIANISIEINEKPSNQERYE
nr:MAG TPA: hypothetical protein [Caudoviricetes sp.]